MIPGLLLVAVCPFAWNIDLHIPLVHFHLLQSLAESQLLNVLPLTLQGCDLLPALPTGHPDTPALLYFFFPVT